MNEMMVSIVVPKLFKVIELQIKIYKTKAHGS